MMDLFDFCVAQHVKFKEKKKLDLRTCSFTLAILNARTFRCEWLFKT